MVPFLTSEASTSRFEARTPSLRSKLAMASRILPSMMSSSRLWPPRSSWTARKNVSAFSIRHRAKVSTQMYFLSRVGICSGEPSQAIHLLSKRLTVSMKGTFK